VFHLPVLVLVLALLVLTHVQDWFVTLNISVTVGRQRKLVLLLLAVYAVSVWKFV